MNQIIYHNTGGVHSCELPLVMMVLPEVASHHRLLPRVLIRGESIICLFADTVTVWRSNSRRGLTREVVEGRKRAGKGTKEKEPTGL